MLTTSFLALKYKEIGSLQCKNICSNQGVQFMAFVTLLCPSLSLDPDISFLLFSSVSQTPRSLETHLSQQKNTSAYTSPTARTRASRKASIKSSLPSSRRFVLSSETDSTFPATSSFQSRESQSTTFFLPTSTRTVFVLGWRLGTLM